MDHQSPVQFVECRTADELLDSLSPRGKYLVAEHDLDSFVFRGHGDQRFESADRTGLPLPEDSQALRESLFELRYLNAELRDWPRQNLLSLIALAQHSGLPTRLLDWSRSAFIAAYFAAIEAAKWNTKSNDVPGGITRLAVWAFKAAAYDLNMIALQNLPARVAKIREITLVTPPTASNLSLRAQMGVFTLRRNGPVDLDAPADREPMDCVVKNLKAEDDIHNNLIEFSLPICESPKLLHLLARESIDAAALFPGYDGAARALREKQYWD